MTFSYTPKHNLIVMYSYFFLMAINAKPKWLKYVRPLMMHNPTSSATPSISP